MIAAEAFRTIIGSHLGVGIAVEPRRVELRVGPLPIDRESEEEQLPMRRSASWAQWSRG